MLITHLTQERLHRGFAALVEVGSAGMALPDLAKKVGVHPTNWRAVMRRHGEAWGCFATGVQDHRNRWFARREWAAAHRRLLEPNGFEVDGLAIGHVRQAGAEGVTQAKLKQLMGLARAPYMELVRRLVEQHGCVRRRGLQRPDNNGRAAPWVLLSGPEHALAFDGAQAEELAALRKKWASDRAECGRPEGRVPAQPVKAARPSAWAAVGGQVTERTKITIAPVKPTSRYELTEAERAAALKAGAFGQAWAQRRAMPPAACLPPFAELAV